MSKNNSFLCNSFLASTYIGPCWLILSGSSHNLFFIVSLKQLVPNLRLFRSLMPDGNTGTSRQIMDCLTGLSTINFLKGTICFGIGFFQEYNPKFLFISSGKGSIFARRIYYDIAIKLINGPLSINTQPY